MKNKPWPKPRSFRLYEEDVQRIDEIQVEKGWDKVQVIRVAVEEMYNRIFKKGA